MASKEKNGFFSDWGLEDFCAGFSGGDALKPAVPEKLDTYTDLAHWFKRFAQDCRKARISGNP